MSYPYLSCKLLYPSLTQFPPQSATPKTDNLSSEVPADAHTADHKQLRDVLHHSFLLPDQKTRYTSWASTEHRAEPSPHLPASDPAQSDSPDKESPVRKADCSILKNCIRSGGIHWLPA